MMQYLTYQLLLGFKKKSVWQFVSFLSVSRLYFFFLWGLPYPLAIQAWDSSVMAPVRAINMVCLVSFLAGCIKHWMTVADYSWDLFPHTCWVWEIQVNGGTLEAAQWDRMESGCFEFFHVTFYEMTQKQMDMILTPVLNISDVHQMCCDYSTDL